MAKTSSDKILLKRLVDTEIEEFILAEAASPGHLVELLSAGTVQKTDSNFGTGNYILTENETQGKDKTTAYTSGDTGIVAYTVPGMVVQARVAASATAIAKGDRLGVVDGGTVGKLTIPAADLTNAQLGYFGIALEAVDNSGGSEEVFIKVRVA